MQIITSTDALSVLCARLAEGPYVTLDTEFMRESTYWPRLCLIQIAGPEEAGVIDPLANGISIEPLDRLLADTSTVKVFHAARQDIEIFYNRKRSHSSINYATPQEYDTFPLAA